METVELNKVELELRCERWPLKNPFAISREVITATDIVVASLSDGQYTGRGECWPTQHYGESVAGVLAQLEALRPKLANGFDRLSLQQALPPGPARNALDCAWWDLEAKRSGRVIWDLLGLARPATLTTAVTISLDTPEKMARQTRALSGWPLFKIKLGRAADDLTRVAAIREVAPQARLFVDVNEGWDMRQLECMVAPLAELGVEIIEQPLPADADESLRGFASPVPLAADESCHDLASLDKLYGKYQMINIKLDKSGGLTEALQLAAAARERQLLLMTGCMLGTSLAMAPAYVLASQCQLVDIDAPVAHAADRAHAMRYAKGRVDVFSPELWG